MRRLTTEEFINKAKDIHNDKYNYTNTVYVNAVTKVSIICPTHGVFYQLPSSHLQGHGCPYCGGSSIKTTEQFIQEATNKWGDTYDYSKTTYRNALTKVCIICPEHGEFWQPPSSHLQGHGCPKCHFLKNGLRHRSNTDEFIIKAKKVHGNKYDYSKVNYVKAKEKVCIICPVHGEFYQTPCHHLIGNGCPKCNYSKMESIVENALLFNNVQFESQKKFKWLGKQSLDFYLPKYNIAIECQGEQHYKPIKYIGGDNKLSVIQERDKRKLKLCNQNDIDIFYIKYTDDCNEAINRILENIDTL